MPQHFFTKVVRVKWMAILSTKINFSTHVFCSVKSRKILIRKEQDRFTTCFKTCGTNSWVFPKHFKKVQKTVQTNFSLVSSLTFISLFVLSDNPNLCSDLTVFNSFYTMLACGGECVE